MSKKPQATSPTSRQTKTAAQRSASTSRRQSSSKSQSPVVPAVPKRRRVRHRRPSRGYSGRDTQVKSTAYAAGTNMMDALGGREQVISILADSGHPKAQALIDRLSSSTHIGENFATSYTSVGLRAVDILQIINDTQQARVFIKALMEGDAVMESLVRRAKDQLETHDLCDGTGRVVDRKTGKQTGEDCKRCKGTGYMLKDGSLEAQELYFELVSWKKSGGGININNDLRKQQVVQVQGGQSIAGLLPGEAPSAMSIIKRADQVFVQPTAAQSQLSAGVPSAERMPEEVMEGEVV